MFFCSVLIYPVNLPNQIVRYLEKQYIQKPPTTFEIQVLSTSAIKCRGNFQIFHFALAIRQQKNCWILDKNLCILCQQWLASTFCQGVWLGFFSSWNYNLCILCQQWLASTFCQGVWLGFFSSWNYLLYLNYIVYFIFLVSSCALVIVGKHYPMLEKLDSQNIAACENLGKQRAFNDHWKSIKTLLLLLLFLGGITWHDAKRQKEWLKCNF